MPKGPLDDMEPHVAEQIAQDSEGSESFFELFGCFPASAKVLTASGYKSISMLRGGELVVAYDKAGKFSAQKILKTKKYSQGRIFHITTSQGDLRVTSHHALKTDTGWRQVRDISAGDTLQAFHDGALSCTEVLKIERDSLETVYNLIIENDYTFIVDGYVAHSFGYFREIRVALSRLVRNSLSKQNPASPEMGSPIYGDR